MPLHCMTTQMKPLTIGTPLSPSATRVMLLGSGELGKEVIIALQRLGVETIAVDRYANAPGQQVAHRAHVINMADGARCARWSSRKSRTSSCRRSRPSPPPCWKRSSAKGWRA